MKNKGIAYKRMIISFAMMFVLPLFLVLGIYLYSYQVIERQIEASNDNFVHTIQSACDRELQFYQNILTQLSINEQVGNLARRDELTNTDRVAAKNLMSNIFELQTSVSLLGNECQDIFVYFPKIDMVFSFKEKGSLRIYTYAKDNLTGNAAEILELKSYLSQYQKLGLTSSKVSSFGGEMVLMTSSSVRDGDQSRATLGVWLDMNELVDRISSVDWGHGYDWLILDSAGLVVKGASDQYPLGEEMAIERLSENDDFMIYTAKSDIAQWTYVLLMPREHVQSSAEKIQTFFAFSIVSCVLIAYFLIIKMTRLNYAPLENLLDALQVKNGGDTGLNNEYQILSDQIKRLMHEKVSMESDISTSRKSLKQWGLINLLLNPEELHSKKRNSEWDQLIDHFSSGFSLVLMIRERGDGDREDAQTFTPEMKHFIVENIFLEGMGAVVSCTMVELEGRQLLVANSPNMMGEIDRIKDTACELQSIIFDHFRLSLTVVLGGIHSGLDGVHKSYLEAREAEEFIPILDQDFISYDDIKDKTSHRYNYSLQAEERIGAAVQSNNIPLAIALIHKVIDTSWSDELISPNIRRLLLHDIFCTLLKTADEKGCLDKIYMIPKDLGSNDPVPEIKAHFTKVVESICDASLSVSEISAKKALCAKVLDYIHLNYNDPNLNISQTAFYFHISPTTLSSTFKNETGKSLLLAINEFRIERATEFLKQGYSVADTAVKVGVPESSSFIRLFKKHTGVTPGQMKNQLFEKK